MLFLDPPLEAKLPEKQIIGRYPVPSFRFWFYILWHLQESLSLTKDTYSFLIWNYIFLSGMKFITYFKEIKEFISAEL